MNIREANLKKLRGRRRDSEDMQPIPIADKEVIAALTKRHPNALIHIDAHVTDKARLEHSYWAISGDWQVARYHYYVDDDSGGVYRIVYMEL
jgi:hypothetical protein